MSAIEDVLHKLIDVAAGRVNLPQHDADAAHDAITPGYNDLPVTEEEAAAAQAVLDRLQREADAKAAANVAAAAPAEPDAAGAAEGVAF